MKLARPGRRRPPPPPVEASRTYRVLYAPDLPERGAHFVVLNVRLHGADQPVLVMN